MSGIYDIGLSACHPFLVFFFIFHYYVSHEHVT